MASPRQVFANKASLPGQVFPKQVSATLIAALTAAEISAI
jgi:hypothetical protein